MRVAAAELSLAAPGRGEVTLRELRRVRIFLFEFLEHAISGGTVKQLDRRVFFRFEFAARLSVGENQG